MTQNAPIHIPHSSPTSMTAPGSHGLGTDLVERVGDVVQLLREIIASSPVPIGTPAALSKAFGVDRALGWRVWSACNAKTLTQAAFYLCGSNALERFGRRASAVGIDVSLCRALERAASALEDWIDDAIGDRTTFRLMVRSAADFPENTEPKHPKAGFDSDRERVGQFAHTVTLSLVLCETSSGQTGAGIAITIFDLQALSTGTTPYLLRMHSPHTKDSLSTVQAHKSEGVDDAVQVHWHSGPHETKQSIAPLEGHPDVLGISHSLSALAGVSTLSLSKCWSPVDSEPGTLLAPTVESTIPASRTIVRVVDCRDVAQDTARIAVQEHDRIASSFNAKPSTVARLGPRTPPTGVSPAVSKALGSEEHSSTVLHVVSSLGVENPEESLAASTQVVQSAGYYPVGIEIQFTHADQ